MRAEIEAEYKAKLREFVQEKGRAVQFVEQRYSWSEPDDVSTYGWTDYDAEKHIHPWDAKDERCSWVVPEGATLTERTYSQFTDTFHSNENEVGINVAGCHCACGKYTDMTLRYVGSLTEVLHSLLGIPTRTEIVL